MVEPAEVSRVLALAASVVGSGEIIVFGSAALAFSLPLSAAPRSHDIDVLCDVQDNEDMLEATMGELSLYHERHNVHIQTSPPGTFKAPSDWRDRAYTYDAEALRALLAEDARFDLQHFPLPRDEARRLDARMPYRDGSISDPESLNRYNAHYQELLSWLR